MTPTTVQHRRAEQTHAQRAGVLDAAYAATPERSCAARPHTKFVANLSHQA